jgi:hypothetical protein
MDDAEFTIHARYSDHEVMKSIHIDVVDAARIGYFVAWPERILKGQSAVLAWHCTGADEVTLSGEYMKDPLSDTQAIVAPDETSHYRLMAVAHDGLSGMREASVEVLDAIPPGNTTLSGKLYGYTGLVDKVVFDAASGFGVMTALSSEGRFEVALPNGQYRFTPLDALGDQVHFTARHPKIIAHEFPEVTCLGGEQEMISIQIIGPEEPDVPEEPEEPEESEPPAALCTGRIGGTISGSSQFGTLSDVTVYLHLLPDKMSYRMTGLASDGTYEFRELPPGEYVVVPRLNVKIDTDFFNPTQKRVICNWNDRVTVDFKFF